MDVVRSFFSTTTTLSDRAYVKERGRATTPTTGVAVLAEGRGEIPVIDTGEGGN